MAAAAQLTLLTKATELCNSMMQCLAPTPGQQETPPQEPLPHLSVSVYMRYDDVKFVADIPPCLRCLGSLHHKPDCPAAVASQHQVLVRVAGPLHQPGRLPDKSSRRVSACGLRNADSPRARSKDAVSGRKSGLVRSGHARALQKGRPEVTGVGQSGSGQKIVPPKIPRLPHQLHL